MGGSRDFDGFKREFQRYQSLFGLNDWKVYFQHGPSEEYFASLEISFTDRVATAFINTDLAGKDLPHRDVRGNAKHEALHLLLAAVEGHARARYATPNAITEAIEAAVRRLETLVP